CTSFDSLNEDDAERESLLAKPTCFIIIGRPVIHTHTNTSVLEYMLHLYMLIKMFCCCCVTGYVLSCLPFMSEECMKIHEQIELIKNLKLTPDFIINIRCTDKDLIQRLSGQKQHPETGRLYNRDQWKREEVYNKKTESTGEEVEDEEEQEIQKESVDQMVWTPENLSQNVSLKISIYKDTMLRPLEFNYMYLLQEDLLRIMSSSRTVAPGFRWKRSRWGQACPVALMEGKLTIGRPELSVGFQDKLYFLSSKEAYQKFVTNPRRYLVPPMPRPPCRVSIIGPSQSGKSTLCKLLTQHYGAVILDMEEMVQPVLDKVEQERLDKIKEETTMAALEAVKAKLEVDGGKNSGKMNLVWFTVIIEHFILNIQTVLIIIYLLTKHLIEQIEAADADADVKTGWVLDNFPKNFSQMEALQQAEILPDILFCLSDSDGTQGRKHSLTFWASDSKFTNLLQTHCCTSLCCKHFFFFKPMLCFYQLFCSISILFRNHEKQAEEEDKPSELHSTLETVIEETEGINCP
uniref:Uncharacterized protein n=1 Tax=Sphaeramia orbicularis TaxID=375764 RepID=A0A673AJA2_9TELE